MPTTLYYTDLGPSSRSCILLIRYLNLNVQLQYVDLSKGGHLAPWMVEKNPTKLIPFLDDNGFIVSESRAICQYLVESKARGSTLLGTDAKTRATVQQRLQYDLGTLFPKLAQIYCPILAETSNVVLDSDKKDLLSTLDILDKTIRRGYWVAGDISIADFVILANVATAVALGVDLSIFRNVNEWYDSCKSLPGFKENEEGAQKLAELFRSKLTEEFEF